MRYSNGLRTERLYNTDDRLTGSAYSESPVYPVHVELIIITKYLPMTLFTKSWQGLRRIRLSACNSQR